MGEVIDQSEEFRLLRMRQMYGRLAAMVDGWEREVEENPWPTIDKMGERINQLHDLLLAVDDTLNPLPVMIPDGERIEYVDPLVEDHHRLNKARELLSAWRIGE